MNTPETLQYTQEHEWVKIEGSTATIGITDFAQSELGDVVYIDVNAIGKEVHQHEVFGTVEAVKTVSDLFMPISGKVIEFNKTLETSPEKINKDPYGEGWIIKVQMANPAEASGLLTAEKYKKLTGSR